MREIIVSSGRYALQCNTVLRMGVEHISQQSADLFTPLVPWHLGYMRSHSKTLQIVVGNYEKGNQVFCIGKTHRYASTLYSSVRDKQIW